MLPYYSFSDSSLVFSSVFLPNEIQNYSVKSPIKNYYFQVLIGFALHMSVKQANLMMLNFMLDMFVYFVKEISVY